MVPRIADRLLLVAAALVTYACHPSIASSSFQGRATYYGNGDGFTLNDGSCACHKQDVRSTWLNSRCERGFCFDYIGDFYIPGLCNLAAMLKCITTSRPHIPSLHAALLHCDTTPRITIKYPRQHLAMTLASAKNVGSQSHLQVNT